MTSKAGSPSGVAILRWPIALLLCLSVSGSLEVFGGVQKAECLSTSDGKEVSGTISIASDEIRFTSKKHDQGVPIGSITRISAGEFAERRTVGSIVKRSLKSWPSGGLSAFGKKKREMFAIEYENEDGERGVLMFQVKEQFGVAVEKELEAATGRKVEWEEEREPEKKKKKKEE